MKKNQSPLESLIEAAINTGVAFGLSLLSHVWIIGPIYLIYIAKGGDITSYECGIYTTLFYTGLSFGRNYFIRRFCERFMERINAYVLSAAIRINDYVMSIIRRMK